jgi:hypothetical protein
VGNPTGFLNEYNRSLEKSLTNFDVTHRLVAQYNLDLPFGRAKRWLKNVTGVAGWVVPDRSIHLWQRVAHLARDAHARHGEF